MFGRNKQPAATQVDPGSDNYRHNGQVNIDPNADPLADIPKTRWQRIWPAMACGSGLFSDGYINNVKSQLCQLTSITKIN